MRDKTSDPCLTWCVLCCTGVKARIRKVTVHAPHYLWYHMSIIHGATPTQTAPTAPPMCNGGANSVGTVYQTTSWDKCWHMFPTPICHIFRCNRTVWLGPVQPFPFCGGMIVKRRQLQLEKQSTSIPGNRSSAENNNQNQFCLNCIWHFSNGFIVDFLKGWISAQEVQLLQNSHIAIEYTHSPFVHHPGPVAQSSKSNEDFRAILKTTFIVAQICNVRSPLLQR